MTSVAFHRAPRRWRERIDVTILAAGDHGLRDLRQVGRDDSAGYMGPERASVVPVDRGQRRSTTDEYRLARIRHGRLYGVPERSAPLRLAGRGVDGAHGLVVAPDKDDAATDGRR